jgi:hypothetical protein
MGEKTGHFYQGYGEKREGNFILHHTFHQDMEEKSLREKGLTEFASMDI